VRREIGWLIPSDDVFYAIGGKEGEIYYSAYVALVHVVSIDNISKRCDAARETRS